MILRPLFNVPPEHHIDDVDIHRLAPLRPRPLDQPEPETPVLALERLRPPVCRLQPHLPRAPEETAPALADPALRRTPLAPPIAGEKRCLVCPSLGAPRVLSTTLCGGIREHYPLTPPPPPLFLE